MKILNLISTLVVVLFFASCSGGSNTATISTDYGDIEIELYDSTPKHKANFNKLVKDGFYNDLIFHRVMKNFMIQGGDPKSKNAGPNVNLGGGGPGYEIDAEIGGLHYKGAVAGARTPDNVNPKRKSSGSQFYIVQGIDNITDEMLDKAEQVGKLKYTPEQRAKYKKVGGYPFLDNQYTVFGEVTSGLDVVDKIGAVQTGRANRPVKDVKMQVK